AARRRRRRARPRRLAAGAGDGGRGTRRRAVGARAARRDRPRPRAARLLARRHRQPPLRPVLRPHRPARPRHPAVPPCPRTHPRAMTTPLVLCYHGISDSWPNAMAVGPAQLERQLLLLLHRGYTPATFTRAVLAPPGDLTL